jgi:hypothetical protein
MPNMLASRVGEHDIRVVNQVNCWLGALARFQPVGWFPDKSQYRVGYLLRGSGRVCYPIGVENVNEPLASHPEFALRLFGNFLLCCLIITVSLFVGMWGYHHWLHLSWVDSYLNASMILSGMGPLASVDNEAGKLFAGTYALYSGLIVVLTAGLLIAPIAHRVMHRFHIECD